MKFTTLITFILLATSVQAEAPITTLQDHTPEELVEFVFKEDADRMIDIFTCESGLRQFDSKGNVIKSYTNDYGIAQINFSTWDKKAKEMGLDYKGSMIDNLKMAKHIYEVSGENAWVCASKV